MNTDSSPLCYKTTAQKILGLHKQKFDQLGLKPVKTIPNPRYQAGPPAQLYELSTIEALAGSPQVLALRSQPRPKVDYAARFAQKYGQPKRACLPVATAMFNLNRYAKHDTCRVDNKREIYTLKDRLIQVFYEQDLCQRCYLQPKGPSCWACYGHDRYCSDCNGRGVYGTYAYVVFHFSIEGIPFSWHQPLHKLTFIPDYTDDETPFTPQPNKPLTIRRRDLSEAKALVKWYLKYYFSTD